MLFSVFFDRVYHALHSHTNPRTNRGQYDTYCHFLTLQLTILLFADDVVLLAKTLDGLQSLFHNFSAFCTHHHLKINEKKSEIMPVNVPDPPQTLQLEDFTFQTTTRFKYLGLHLSPAADAPTMLHHTLINSRVAFNRLCDFIGTQGWTTVWTNLCLFDVLVRSIMLYGAPVWAPKSLYGDWGATSIFLKPLQTFHRTCLRTLTHLPRDTRNSILYITTNKFPVTTLIAKSAWRYYKRLEDQRNPASTPLGVVANWLLHQ